MQKVEKYANEKKVKFVWDSPLKSMEISITIPGFFDCEYNVWGDWGSMYTIKVDPKKPINISYLDLKSNKKEEHILKDSSFEFNSPILAEEREKLPFFYKIKDLEMGFIFELYVNKDAEVVKAEVFKCEDRKKLFSVPV